MTARPKIDFAAAVIDAAKLTCWWEPAQFERLTDITPEFCRDIATKLASYAFRMGPETWNRPQAALASAWDAYCLIDPVAMAAELAAEECPF